MARKSIRHGSESSFSGFSDNDNGRITKEERQRQAKIASQLADKDSDEEELERLVLGDKASFRAQLFREDFFTADSKGSSLVEEEDQAVGEKDTDGLSGLDDSALFFLDTDPGEKAQKGAMVLVDGEGKKSEEDAPVWQDSDDERLTISLQAVPRLRRLRTTADEDSINGLEYTQRLRMHYLRLYGVPAWAKEADERASRRDANKGRKRSRRRKSDAQREEILPGSERSEDDEESSGSDEYDADWDDAPPLERFLRDANSFMADGSQKRGRSRLKPGTIGMQRLRDIPDPHAAAVASMQFHPKLPVLLSASTSSIMHLHHLDPTALPTPNPMLASVQMRKTPIRRAGFLGPDGDEIVVAGRRRFLHSWNLASGRVQRLSQIHGHPHEHKSMESFRPSPDGRHLAIAGTHRMGGGVINLVAAATMQWVAQIRVDSRHGIGDFAWWRDGGGLTVLGRDGNLVEWSLSARRTLGIWRDEGSVGGNIGVLTLGGPGGPAALGGDRWVAVGSQSGILNLYDRHTLLQAISTSSESIDVNEMPTPARCFEQLTTAITAVAISPDGQLLVFASRKKADALKLVHLPSCTVYRNWPTEQTPLGRVTALAFACGSNMLGVGNDVGRMRLWNILQV